MVNIFSIQNQFWQNPKGKRKEQILNEANDSNSSLHRENVNHVNMKKYDLPLVARMLQVVKVCYRFCLANCKHFKCCKIQFRGK